MYFDVKTKESEQLVTFMIDRMYLGLEVHKVQEVIRSQAMTNVPLSNQYITGLINLRGQIIPAINLRKILSLPDHDEKPMNVVVGSESGPLCVLVDAVGDVIDVNSANFERVPETLPISIKQISCGVSKLKNNLVLIIDPEKLVALLVNQ